MKIIGNIFQKIRNFIEKYLIILTVTFFLGGIFLAKYIEGFGAAINNGAEGFIEGYGYVAPLAIFLILAPSLAKMFSSKSGKFGWYAVVWLGTRRLLACIWAVLATVLVFGFPLLPSHDISVWEAVKESLNTVGRMAVTSPFMIAIWAGIVTAIISIKVKWLFRVLDKILSKFEAIGEYFISLVPFFMMAVGAYVYNLPSSVSEQIELNGEYSLHTVNLFGFILDPNKSSDMIWIYVLGALLVGVVCFSWHLILLFIAKWKVKGFSLKVYFFKYWIKVYPLLWATSSEALATPLNLYLTKKYFPEINKVVRRFVVGMGSYLNINGTLICVFILAGIVTTMLGYQPSLLEWLLAVPIVFLLGYGVPGIPGELVLFAGPIVILLNLPEEVIPVFLALYIGLQIGLPDSFRTGNNSTDNCVCAVLLNKVYNEKFADQERERVSV